MAISGTKKENSYTPVADYFIALSNVTGSLISNLKLQKIVYYTQAWHLANFNEEIIKEDFQAWIHGPVIPALYGEYKHFGWQPIVREDLDQKSIDKLKTGFSSKTGLLLDLVTDGYFGLSAFELERLTHGEDPWLVSRGSIAEDQPSENIIPKNLMMEYYKRFIKDGSENKQV